MAGETKKMSVGKCRTQLHIETSMGVPLELRDDKF